MPEREAEGVGKTPGNESRTAGHLGLQSLTDEELAELVKDANNAAFSILIQRHTDRHLAIAERVLRNRANAEDAVQDAFIKFWSNANMYDANTAKFSTWFYRVLVNRCLDVKRKKQPVTLPEDFDKADESPGPAQKLDEKAVKGQVKKALQALPERQRLALVLCYFEEFSNKEAADIMDIHIKALESLLTRGRKSLADQLQHFSESLLEVIER